MNYTQCKMARAALNWSANDLARESGLSYATVARIEGGFKISDISIAAIQSALEANGVTISATDDRVTVSAPR